MNMLPRMFFAGILISFHARIEAYAGTSVPHERGEAIAPAAAVVPPQAWTWPVTAEPEHPAKPSRPSLKDGGPWQGMPLGGFGTGGIVRNIRGAFSRWTLKAGALKHFCEPANMFAVRQQVEGRQPVAYPLYPGYPSARPAKAPPKVTALSSWGWAFTAEGCTFHALFPKAWRRYPAAADAPVAMVCEEFSPVWPNNYQESGYPVALFLWHLENTSDKPVKVSLMFSLINMTGWFDTFGDDRPARCNAGNINRAFARECGGGSGAVKGVLMERLHVGRGDEALKEGDGQFCIAALERDGCRVTCHAGFDAGGDGSGVWEPFATAGDLRDSAETWACTPNQRIAGAVCVSATLAPGEKRTMPVALAWDLPRISFGSGREHWRHYTRFTGREGRHGADLAAEALARWPEWSRQIDAWHRNVTASAPRPDWFYGMLFNEAYLLVDGYTVWTDGTVASPGEDPFFGVIECPDYPYYCTLDLWSYGSFALAKYWPELEKNVMRRFARVILQEDPQWRRLTSTGELYRSKLAGAAPHDFGQPEEDPPVTCNSYAHRDSNRWKDLNPHFVLALARDVRMTGDMAFLKECWPAAKAAIEYLARFDTDGDGLIENDGTPDQTMDNIPMKGVSAYCGGLWLAALHAAVELAERTGDRAFAEAWRPKAATARAAFDRLLWDGQRYRLDTAGPYSGALYVDSLFGIWYGRLCGLVPLVPEEHYKQHLLAVFNTNFKGFHGGAFGCANITGIQAAANREVESDFNPTGCQVSEVLSGLNMSFAGQLLDAGLQDEGMRVLASLERVIYHDCGLWFRTPAAWSDDGTFRAIMNLRPLVIWALADARGAVVTGDVKK